MKTYLMHAFIGAACATMGYCIGVKQAPDRVAFYEQGRQSVHEEIRTQNLELLVQFVQQYRPSPSEHRNRSQKKETPSILELWNVLPDALKEKFLEQSKAALANTVKDGYSSLKEQSSELYEEMRYFLNKKIEGGEK